MIGAGWIGAVVIAATIGWGVITHSTDGPTTSGGTTVVCNALIAAECRMVEGVGTVLDHPDAYAAAHP